MRAKKTHLSASLLLLFCLSQLPAQNDVEGAKRSVVKITTSYIETTGGKQSKKIGTATGWCWKEPTLVVTALHAVAGIKNENITVYSNNGTPSQATVLKVLKEADLALLRIKTDLGLKPLPLLDMTQSTTKEFVIWGFPQGVYAIQGDDIRFSKTIEAVPTLNSIVTATQLKADLRGQGYPLPEARIFRISSIIQPGHSGAPIFTSDGQVIGIADGGLRGGAARINWAMPAAYYVPLLNTSNDLIPATVSLQNTLYSNNISVPLDATDEEENALVKQEEESNTIELDGKQSISQTWSTTYQTILDNSDEESKNTYNNMCKQWNVDLSDVSFDVYEDFETGVVIALPGGIKPKVENGLYTAANSDESLNLSVLSTSRGSFSEAEAYAESILTSVLVPDEWNLTYDTTFSFNSGTGICKEIIRSYTSREDVSQVFSVATKIDGVDILITLLGYNNTLLTKPDYAKQYLVWEIAKAMGEIKENGR